MVSAPFATDCNNLIDVPEEEAAGFSCNAVVLERDIVLPEGAPKLVGTLRDRGYHMSPAADERIPESRRRLQVPDHAHAAARERVNGAW